MENICRKIKQMKYPGKKYSLPAEFIYNKHLAINNNYKCEKKK